LLKELALDAAHERITIFDVRREDNPIVCANESFARLTGSFADRHVIASPKAATERLNQLFPMNQESRQYFTLIYGVLHLPTRRLTYVTAGHPAPVLLSERATCRNLTVGGFPVGLVQQPEYEERTIDLSPGDRLYVYTDGLIEATREDGREFGVEQLGEQIERGRELSLKQSVEALEATAKGWAGGRLHDDLSILALEIARAPDGRVSPESAVRQGRSPAARASRDVVSNSGEAR
jgi:serine phosphatase RsbU (regulator of sigma subunit)